MPSPAINRNEYVTAKCLHRMVDGYGNETNLTESYLWRADLQGRPKSKSNPKRLDGTRPPGAWTHVWRRSSAEICDVSYTDRSSYPYYKHWFFGAFPPDTGVIQQSSLSRDPKVLQRARLKCLQQLKDQKVNLGVALAEARQTAELVGSAASDIAKQIRRFKDRNPKDWAARKSWKKVPGRYLEMSYGWVPLLNDIDGSCNELSQLVTGRRLVPQVTAKGSARITDVKIVESGGRDWMRTSRLEIEQQAHVSLVGKAPSWVMQEFSRLGLTNPLSILWEKVPYSFVADWFLPVGSWVDSFDATNYLRFSEGSETEIVRGKLVGSELRFDRPLSQKADVKYHRYRGPTYDAGEFVRNIIYDFPSASFPSLRAPLSLDKLAKSLALLTQVLR